MKLSVEGKVCKWPCLGGATAPVRVLVMCLAWWGVQQICEGAALQDMFADRETIDTPSGQIRANNTNATVELGEPRHAGKIGGHSMWISWIAPSNGVARFETDGSGFDTLLSAYYFVSTNDTTFDKLFRTAGADDSEGFDRESEIEFGVVAGQRYQIAVDGYDHASGPVELQWKLDVLPDPPPVVLGISGDRSARAGDPVTVSVSLANAANARLKWFFNSSELNVVTTNLLIPSLQATDVGRYKLRIDVDGVRFFTAPIEIQINSEGATNTLARGKLLDAQDTPLIGANGGGSALLSLRKSARQLGGGGLHPLGGGAGIGVVSGYNGAQIFNTTYATVDTNEPPHCGVSGGSSYWLIYQPPTNGTITLDTSGSTYDTVIEAYTYNGMLAGYQDLISVACDNDGVSTNGASRVRFAVVTSRQYVVAVEGVNNAHGTASLNYTLDTNQLPQKPTLLSPPAPVVVTAGSDVTLAAALSGSAPLQFFWSKDGVSMPSARSSVLAITNATPVHSGSYVLSVTNDVGNLTTTLPLRVVVAPRCDVVATGQVMSLTFPTIAAQVYVVEEAESIAGPWQPWTNFYAGDGQVFAATLPALGTRFYRVRVE